MLVINVCIAVVNLSKFSCLTFRFSNSMGSNLLRLFSIFLIFVVLFVYCQDTTDYSQCNRDLPVNQVNSDFGTLNGFYSIAKGIAYGLQGQLPDDVVQDIYNLLTQGSGVQNIGDLVSAIIKSQGGTIAFWCIGLVIILASLILAIVFCIGRCCCESCGVGKQDKSSKIKIIIYLVLLVAAFALIITAIIIYNQSALNVYSQIDKGDEYTNLIFDDLQSVMSNGTEELTCSTNVGINQTFSTMTTQMQQFPNSLFSNFSDQTGITALQRDNDTTLPAIKEQTPICQTDVDKAQSDLEKIPKTSQGCNNEIQNLTATLTNISILLASLNNWGIGQIQTGMNDLLTTVNANINATNITIGVQIQQSTDQMTQTQAQISQTINEISSSVNDTMGQVHDIANIIKIGRKDVVDWSGYGWVKMSVRLIFTLPAAITLLFIALTVLALVFVFISKNDPGNRSKVSSLFGVFAILGFYYVIWTTWLVMGTSSTEFVGGWAIAGACKPLFGDPTYRVFNSLTLNNSVIHGYGDSSVTLNIGDILTKCSDPSAGVTLFSAINGTVLLNPEDIEQQMNLISFKDQIDKEITDADLSYSVDQNLTDLLNATMDQLTKYLKSLNDLGPNYIPQCKSVDESDTAQAIKDLQKLNDDFNILVQNFTTLYSDITFSSNQLSSDHINETKSGMIDTTNSQFDLSYGIVNGSLYDLINQLSSQAFPCYPLVNIYINTGNIICDAFGRPIHGIWASSGLAAIIYLPLAIILLLSSRWLFIGNSSGSFYTSGRTKKGKGNKNHAALTSAWEQDELPPPQVVHLPSPYESSPYESSSGVRVHPYNQHDDYGSRSLGQRF